MSDSTISGTMNPVRPTLRLKVAPREAPVLPRDAIPARPTPSGKAKPGARWSDHYKMRMQADMDALSYR